MVRRSRRRSTIFGWSTRISNESGPPVRTFCPSCRAQSQLVGKRHGKWFTLYFIPIFPMDSGTRFTQCTQCHAQFRANIDEFRRMAANAAPPIAGGAPPPLPGSNVYAPAIALHNDLLETPGDSAKLLRLMQLYPQLKVPGEALAAIRAFPRALESSDACLALAATIFLQRSDIPSARRHAAAALALNPYNADAQQIQAEAANGVAPA